MATERRRRNQGQAKQIGKTGEDRIDMAEKRPKMEMEGGAKNKHSNSGKTG